MESKTLPAPETSAAASQDDIRQTRAALAADLERVKAERETECDLHLAAQTELERVKQERDTLLAVVRMAAGINPFGHPHNSRTKEKAQAAIAAVESQKCIAIK